MEENNQSDLESLFAQVEDPRMERTRRHRLRDIIILAIFRDGPFRPEVWQNGREEY